MAEKKTRQSNFELLRIVAMIFIVGHHVVYHGGGQFPTDTITINRLWYQIHMYAGHAGLDLFILISGYFMIGQNKLSLSKIAKLWIQLITYSIVMYVLAVVFFGFPHSNAYLPIVLTPFLSEQWPFASAYIALFIFSPFINIMLHKLTKNQYRVLLGIMIIMWVFIPTITTFKVEGNYLSWIITLYSIAGYIRLYPEDFARKSNFYFAIAGLMAVLSYASAIFFDVLGFKWGFFARYATHFSDNQHLNIVIWAVCMLLAFRTINVGTSKLINGAAGLMFGVFLFHENYFARYTLWRIVFDNDMASQQPWYILYFIMEFLVVFAVGMGFEFLRQQLLEKHYVKGLDKLFSGLQNKLDVLMTNSDNQDGK